MSWMRRKPMVWLGPSSPMSCGTRTWLNAPLFNIGMSIHPTGWGGAGGATFAKPGAFGRKKSANDDPCLSSSSST
eukprot:227456-Pyramimonas_sp.AAC.1